jgi:hypothetical protein
VAIQSLKNRRKAPWLWKYFYETPKKRWSLKKNRQLTDDIILGKYQERRFRIYRLFIISQNNQKPIYFNGLYKYFSLVILYCTFKRLKCEKKINCPLILELTGVVFPILRSIASEWAKKQDNSTADSTLHGLINYKDNKAKFRHLKIWPVKGLYSFVNHCLSSFISGALPHPLPCVNMYTVCTYLTQCVRGEGSWRFWVSDS